MPGNSTADVTQRRPALREKDFSEFDLERAVRLVSRMAENF
jgi:hypothetical protein